MSIYPLFTGFIGIFFLKAVFEKEAQELFTDCNEYEVRVLVDVMKATKESMRNVKLFEDTINENK